MDAPQDPWVPAPRDGGRADIRAGGAAGGDPWSATVPFPRVAPAAERLTARVVAEGPLSALAAVPAAAPAGGDTRAPGALRACLRAVARLVHVTVDGVRSLVGLLPAAPASR